MAQNKKLSEIDKPTGLTNYYAATHWLHGSLILCNEIVEIDESVLENMHKDLYDEETGEYSEIYQWYLTSFNEQDVKWLEETFPDLIFSYSDKLNLYVLCVDHYGTDWKYVMTTCTNSNCERKEGEEI